MSSAVELSHPAISMLSTATDLKIDFDKLYLPLLLNECGKHAALTLGWTVQEASVYRLADCPLHRICMLEDVSGKLVFDA